MDDFDQLLQTARSWQADAAGRYRRMIRAAAASHPRATVDNVPSIVLDCIDVSTENFKLDMQTERQRLQLTSELQQKRKLFNATKALARRLDKDVANVEKTRRELQESIAAIEQKLGNHAN